MHSFQRARHTSHWWLHRLWTTLLSSVASETVLLGQFIWYGRTTQEASTHSRQFRSGKSVEKSSGWRLSWLNAILSWTFVAMTLSSNYVLAFMTAEITIWLLYVTLFLKARTSRTSYSSYIPGISPCWRSPHFAIEERLTAKCGSVLHGRAGTFSFAISNFYHPPNIDP